MSTPEAIFAAAVILVAIVAWRNWTAVALIASWGVLQAAWLLTQQWSPMLELICDYGVLVAIFVKEERRHAVFHGLGGQLTALWHDRCPGDRFVMSVFPFMWVLYVSPIDAYYRWWGLWWLSLAQFLAAGCEGFGRWRNSRPRVCEPDTPPGALRLGLPGYV